MYENSVLPFILASTPPSGLSLLLPLLLGCHCLLNFSSLFMAKFYLLSSLTCSCPLETSKVPSSAAPTASTQGSAGQQQQARGKVLSEQGGATVLLLTDITYLHQTCRFREAERGKRATAASCMMPSQQFQGTWFPFLCPCSPTEHYHV
jgi:hypothetical protein